MGVLVIGNVVVLVISFDVRVVVVLGLVKFRPFRQIDTIILRIVRGALHGVHLVGVLFHLLVPQASVCKRGVLTNEVHRQRRPFSVQPMQHIVGVVIKFKNFSLLEVFFCSNKDFRLLLLRDFLLHDIGLVGAFLFLATRLAVADPPLFLLKLVLELILELIIRNILGLVGLILHLLFLEDLGEGDFFYLAGFLLVLHNLGEGLALLVLATHRQQSIIILLQTGSAMELQERMRVGNFSHHSQECLFELKVAGHDSILKLFDGKAKLRSIQRMHLPAKGAVYSCENFILVLSPQNIHLYNLTDSSTSLSCANPGINEVLYPCYHPEVNMIFFADHDNILYYVLIARDQIKVKPIFKCRQEGITGKISKLAVDYHSHVYILFKESKRLLTLTYDWNQDTVKKREWQENIVDLYCRFSWKVLLKQGQNLIELFMQHGLQKHQSILELKHNHNYIIRGTEKDFLFVDLEQPKIVAIFDGEILQSTQHHLAVNRNNRDGFLFEFQKADITHVALNLNFYSGFAQFEARKIILKSSEIGEEFGLDLYIHNNIHLIMTETGLSPHFTEKVQEFLQKDAQNENKQGYHEISDELLSCRLMQKLFKGYPKTVHTLAEHLTGVRGKSLPEGGSLLKYLSYVDYAINQLVPQLQSLWQMEDEEIQQQPIASAYLQRKQTLRTLVGFLSVLQYAVRTQDVLGLKSGIRQKLNEEAQPICLKFRKVLDRCKSLYLLNQLSYEIDNKEVNREVKAEPMQSEQSVRIPRKIGTDSCHQLFDARLTGPKPGHPAVFRYLAECDNFYHAAYLYLLLLPDYDSVPYVSDPETVKLLKFISSTNLTQISRKQKRPAIKSLASHASKALLINEPTFLQYLCSLSVNCQENKTCLAILMSGASQLWPKSTYGFIIQCYVLCDRIMLAYERLASVGDDRGKTYLERLIEVCIKERKVKDLLQISQKSPDHQYIRRKLNNAFGEDIDEIVTLMRELNSNQL